MILNYQKRKNNDLFKDFEKIKKLDLFLCQNYIPLYNNLFSLNHTNFNNINLNNKFFLSRLIDYDEINKSYIGIIKDENTKKEEKREIFIKISPLLDPFKYLYGKYDIEDENIFQLPNLEILKVKEEQEKTPIFNKLYDMNNSSYIDSFFYFLSSMLFNNNNFINGIDYYDYNDGTTIYVAKSSGLTSNWLVSSGLTKDETLINVVDQPLIFSNVYIERGKNSVFERVRRLGEVSTIGGLTIYGYKFFNVNKND